MGLFLHSEFPNNRKPLDSHVPAPLAPEVISQAVDLPVPPHEVVIEANNITNIEANNITNNINVGRKLPKWLKLAQSGCDMQSHLPKFAMWLIIIFQKNKLLGAFNLNESIIYIYWNRNYLLLTTDSFISTGVSGDQPVLTRLSDLR